MDPRRKVADGKAWHCDRREMHEGEASQVTLSADDLRAVRQRAQLLADTAADDVCEVAARLGGVQAQAAPAARLAVRARSIGLTRHNVDCATERPPAVVRTWAMRGTLHMVPAADARWIVDLLGPRFVKAGERRRLQLGLDDDTCRRGVDAIQAVLTDSPPLTRAHLVERLADMGVPLDPKSQAPAHLVAYAALRGVICRGPDLPNGEPTYALLDSWVGTSSCRDRDNSLRELARRYLTGHGPATLADFAAWSGLPVRDARNAFAELGDELVEVDTAGQRMVALAGTDLTPPATCPPRLLGPFDPYLLGYRGRDLILEPAHAKRIQAGGGMIQPAVLAGGRVVGTWRLHRDAKRAGVVVEPFTTLPKGSREGLRAEADDIGRFLGVNVSFEVSPRP